VYSTTQPSEWTLLEAVILSGQMADSDLQRRLKEDTAFAVWLRQRALRRQKQQA
jgi:hypothetical protein